MDWQREQRPFLNVDSGATPTARADEGSYTNYGLTSQHPYDPYDFKSAMSPTREEFQYANYDSKKFDTDTPVIAYPPKSRATNTEAEKAWIPLPLRWFFWVPLAAFLILGAMGLEIALYFSNKNQGWESGKTDQAKTVLHYLYTIPPVIIASIAVSLWVWTVSEIKRLQPYIDLVHGDSPPQKSLLLDYNRYNNLSVIHYSLKNRHVIVLLATLMVFMTMAFQPLASALLVVRLVWWQEPDVVVQNLGALGLDHGNDFSDLTYFLTAAGYAGAAVMYNLSTPPFVNPPYTVARFQMPPASIASNGTAFVNTTAVKTETGCIPATVQMTKTSQGWTNTASSDGCTATFDVDKSSVNLFGSSGLACGYDSPDLSPVAFWFFSYSPTARAAVVFCSPQLSFWEASAGVDIVTHRLGKVTEIRPFTAGTSPFSNLSANITGPPLNGRAYNGIQFDTTGLDQFGRARMNATQLQLPAAIYQAASATAEGYSNSFDGSILADLTNQIYGLYLALVARGVYFLDYEEPIKVQTKTFKSRVFLSPVAVHLLAAALLVLGVMTILLQYLHREERRDLHLQHEPGTIASAVSFGAQTGLAEVLAGRQGEKEIKSALRNRKFRIDSETMKIVMEGEHGYEAAKSPRRKSFINQLLLGSPSDPADRKTSSASTPTHLNPHY